MGQGHVKHTPAKRPSEEPDEGRRPGFATRVSPPSRGLALADDLHRLASPDEGPAVGSAGTVTRQSTSRARCELRGKGGRFGKTATPGRSHDARAEGETLG